MNDNNPQYCTTCGGLLPHSIYICAENLKKKLDAVNNKIIVHMDKEGTVKHVYADQPNLNVYILDERGAAECQDDADGGFFDMTETPVYIYDLFSAPMKDIISTDLEDAMGFYTSDVNGVRTDWMKENPESDLVERGLDALQTLVEQLEESHQDEVAAGHGGDNSCSYCDTLEEAKAVLGEWNGR